MEQSKPRLLITGTTGFAGSSVSSWFLDRGYEVVAPSRRPPADSRLKFCQITALDGSTRWLKILHNVDVVIHLAARAHQVNDGAAAESLYYQTNVDATENLARQALEVNVKRFIFISSTKAMLGSSSTTELNEQMPARPADPYGISKYKAEMALGQLAAEQGLALTILRPPLMYGPAVKGNMASLIKLVQKLPWLPLGGIANRRSLLGIMNLASAIEAVINNPRALGKTYLVSDGEQISTSELTRRLASVFNPGCRIAQMPAWFWRFMTRLPLVAAKIDRLTGCLAVNSSLIERELSWKPPFSMEQQLKEMLLSQ